MSLPINALDSSFQSKLALKLSHITILHDTFLLSSITVKAKMKTDDKKAVSERYLCGHILVEEIILIPRVHRIFQSQILPVKTTDLC